jgi:hypothetical protein
MSSVRRLWLRRADLLEARFIGLNGFAIERLGFDQTPRAEIQIGKILLGTSNFSFVGPLISLVEGKRLFVEVLGSLEIVFFELDVCQLRYNLAEF